MPLYHRPGSPYWHVRIGRKTRRSTRTADREKAEEFERILADRLCRQRRLGDRSAVSWREASERWLKDSPKARRRDREVLCWLSKQLEIDEYPVSAVADPDALEQLRQHGLADGWSHATVDRMMGTVSAVLRACVRWRYLEYAPPVPMFRPRPGEPRWLTRDKFERLCQELPEHLKLAARFAVFSMLRMRAMLRLTWDRVDLAAKLAWVPSCHQKAARSFGFPLSDELICILRELRELNPNGSHVFQYNGKPIDDCNTQAFQEAGKRAGVAPLRWHDLRHTGASWAVQSGVSLQELMLLGDWRSYPMVLRYAHLAPSQAAEAAERVAQWAHSDLRAATPRARKKAKKQGETGGAEGDRTLDLRIANATLSQLSYRPTQGARF
jgi:integrase